MKYKIAFKHNVDIEYETYIEADSEEEALSKFDEEPFDGDLIETG